MNCALTTSQTNKSNFDFKIDGHRVTSFLRYIRTEMTLVIQYSTCISLVLQREKQSIYIHINLAPLKFDVIMEGFCEEWEAKVTIVH